MKLAGTLALSAGMMMASAVPASAGPLLPLHTIIREKKIYKQPWRDSNPQSLPHYTDVVSIKPQAIRIICLQT